MVYNTNKKSYQDFAAPMLSQGDPCGAYNTSPFLYNMHPINACYLPVNATMASLPNTTWTTNTHPLQDPINPTHPEGEVGEGEKKSDEEEEKPKKRRRRRRRRRRKTKYIDRLVYVGVPVFSPLGLMPVPMVDTQADLIKRVLIAEEASNARANHEEQCAKGSNLPEILRLRKEHRAECQREAMSTLAQHENKTKGKGSERATVEVFSRELVERHSKSSSPLPVTRSSSSSSSVRSICMSSSDSGEDEPEYRPNKDNSKTAEDQEFTKPLILDREAAEKHMQKLLSAFDPFLLHISDTESEGSGASLTMECPSGKVEFGFESVPHPARAPDTADNPVSICVKAQSPDSAMQLELCDNVSDASLQIHVESKNTVVDLCVCLQKGENQRTFSWCYCRYCKTYPQICDDKGGIPPPQIKRKGNFTEKSKASFLTEDNLRRHDEQNSDLAKLKHLLLLIFADERICSVILSFLLCEFDRKTDTISQDTKRWGNVKFTKEHFDTDEMKALQASQWFHKTWEESQKQPTTLVKQKSDDTIVPEPKLKLDGIPCWEWSIKELESLGKAGFYSHKKFDYLYTAKRQARLRIYQLLEQNGVPRRLKFRIGIGAYWYGNVVRTNDTCYVTFEDSDESELVCERLVANGITTQANLVRISWDLVPPAGRKAY